jgi:ribosomal protein L7/L12
MDPNSILILLAFIVVIFLILRRFAAAGESSAINQTPPQIDWRALKHVDVQTAIHEKRNIEAIKHYRNLTGVGLAEAKKAIDYVLAHPEATGSVWQNEDEADKPADWVASLTTPDLATEIRDLLSRRQKIEAVKLYREHMGVGLKEAKDAVDDIERAMKL